MNSDTCNVLLLVSPNIIVGKKNFKVIGPGHEFIGEYELNAREARWNILLIMLLFLDKSMGF